MNRRSLMLVALGLVAGLTLGAIGIAGAAPAAETTAPAAATGLRIGPAIRDAGARMVDILAKLTGLSADEVQDRRAAGESVADIAESKGVDSGKVVDEALAARKALLDERVQSGTLSEDDAAAVLDRMESRLNERVTSDAPCGGGAGACGGGGMGGGRGARMGGGFGGGACAGTTNQ